MSDDLRTRIAAALYRSTCTRHDDYPWDEAADYIKAVYVRHADVVIRELDDMEIIHLSKVRHDAFTPWCGRKRRIATGAVSRMRKGSVDDE